MKHTIEQEAHAVAVTPGSPWTKKQVLKVWSQLSHKERGQLTKRLEALAKSTPKIERIQHAHNANQIKAVSNALNAYPNKLSDEDPPVPSRRQGAGRKWSRPTKRVQE